MRVVYADHIEPPLARWWKPFQVFPCDLRHLTALMPVHRRLRGLHVARGSRLNFNEAQNICLPADQVDLPSATRRPKIARHHRIAQLPQVKVRVFLPTRAGALVPRPRVRCQHPLGNPIQAVNNRSRKGSREHDSTTLLYRPKCNSPRKTGKFNVEPSRKGKPEDPHRPRQSASRPKKASPRTTPRARSLSSPKEGSNKKTQISHNLRSAPSRALPRFFTVSITVKFAALFAPPTPGSEGDLVRTGASGKLPQNHLATAQLSPTLESASIHASRKRSSRTKSFSCSKMQMVLTHTKVVVAWHQEAILRPNCGC